MRGDAQELQQHLICRQRDIAKIAAPEQERDENNLQHQ